MELVRIGEFAARSRLSQKALRLYAELGLLVPVRVEEASGYRFYSPDQLDRARLVALLRHLEMPLARIAEVLALPAPRAETAIRDFWATREAEVAARRRTVEYLCTLLTGEESTMEYSVTVRSVPERPVLSAVRHVFEAESSGVLGSLLGRMRALGPGSEAPYFVFLGMVSADSDGPVELVRPMSTLSAATEAAASLGDVQARVEPAHDEAFVRLTMGEVGWPAMLPAVEALERHVAGLGRTVVGPPRQVMIADWRTAGPADPACDLAVPLSPA